MIAAAEVVSAGVDTGVGWQKCHDRISFKQWGDAEPLQGEGGHQVSLKIFSLFFFLIIKHASLILEKP